MQTLIKPIENSYFCDCGNLMINLSQRASYAGLGQELWETLENEVNLECFLSDDTGNLTINLKNAIMSNPL